MVTNADALHALLNLQRALEKSFDSDWLRGSTAGMGSFPPINIFQQGDDFIAIAELPGVSKDEIQIQVQDKAIRVSGRKSIGFGEGASLHRRERLSGQVRPHHSLAGADRCRSAQSRISGRLADAVCSQSRERQAAHDQDRLGMISSGVPHE